MIGASVLPIKHFGRWLVAQRQRQDPVGELARNYLVGGDSCCMGVNVKDPAPLLDHMVQAHDAGDAALQTFERARSEWEQQVTKA